MSKKLRPPNPGRLAAPCTDGLSIGGNCLRQVLAQAATPDNPPPAQLVHRRIRAPSYSITSGPLRRVDIKQGRTGEKGSYRPGQSKRPRPDPEKEKPFSEAAVNFAGATFPGKSSKRRNGSERHSRS